MAQELVPVEVVTALECLAGLQKGRTTARESDPVKPVDPKHVAATLPFLSAQLQTATELQRLTGMRPGEACTLTLAEVDRSEPTWLYRPSAHKTAYRGQDRVIPFGPRARAVLVAFLRRTGAPPDGFAHVELNYRKHSNARRVMADAYEETGRIRDAELLRDVKQHVVLTEGCVSIRPRRCSAPSRRGRNGHGPRGRSARARFHLRS